MNVNENRHNKHDIILSNDILKSFSEALEFESQTIIHCKIKACEILQQGGWANISPSTYLISRQSDERLKLIYTENIPQAPHRHFFRHSNDCLYFTLVFQKLPETWTTFCLYEETALGDGFFVGEVPKNKSGVYRIRIN